MQVTSKIGEAEFLPLGAIRFSTLFIRQGDARHLRRGLKILSALKELTVRRKTNHKQTQHTMHALANVSTGPSDCSKQAET